MKNIYVLPTDKPSRLSKSTSKEELTFCSDIYNLSNRQHIYITSDEEIKEGDYGLGFALGVKGVGRGHYVFKQDGTNVGKLNAICNGSKKIILTTDQDLIKDEVWGIEDGFLEWFVKNPTCDYVELKGYVIILPGESCDCDKMCSECEPKQETLEETAERMYSEKEVQIKLYECLGHFAQKHNIIINGNEIDQWFEQFKNK
jgi:hypothetical protein